MAWNEDLNNNGVLKTVIKGGGEVFLPGTSQFIDGKVGNGILTFAAATLARVAIGPVGFFVVAANSFSTSVTGKNLLQQVGLGGSAAAPEAPVANAVKS